MAGVALAQDPVAPTTDPAVASLEERNDKLRHQLRMERARHQKVLRNERIHRATIVRRFEHRLRTRPSVQHALEVASATYGVPKERLTRVAICESTLRPDASNGPYEGLFQFGTPLWNKTPYREFSRNDPYAASLAASWAFSRGMASHWPVCSRR